MGDPASRRRFGRQDLNELKQYDRAAVFAALGSFDEQGLDDRGFALRAAALLDPERVPGLPDALDSGAADAIAQAVYRACLGRGETRSPALADGPPGGFSNPVPEPSALLVFGAGALALRSVLRKR